MKTSGLLCLAALAMVTVAVAQGPVRPQDAQFVFANLANTNRFVGFVDYARRFQDCTNPGLFRVSAERVTIEEAMAFCDGVGFELLNIESESVQASADDFVGRLIAQGRVDPGAKFWINLQQSDDAETPEDGWTTRNGEEVRFFNWGFNEPNDIAALVNGELSASSENGAEQCAVLDSGNGLFWADEQCVNRVAYAVCQDPVAKARIENCAPFAVYGQALSNFMENEGHANGIAQGFITLASQQELRPLAATYEAVIRDLDGREDLLTTMLFVVTDQGDQDVQNRLVGSTAAGAFATAVIRSAADPEAEDNLVTVFASIFERGGVIARTLMDAVIRSGASTTGAVQATVANVIGSAIAESIQENALAIVGELLQPAGKPQGADEFIAAIYTSAIINRVSPELLGRTAVESILDRGSGVVERQQAAGLAFLMGIEGAMNISDSTGQPINATAPFVAALNQSPGSMYVVMQAAVREGMNRVLVQALVDAAGGAGNVDCDEDNFVVPGLRVVFDNVPENIPVAEATAFLSALQASDLQSCLDDVPQTGNVNLSTDSQGR